MTFQAYQNQTADTAVYPKQQGITYCALKLASEAGEVADAIGKWIRNHGITDINDLKRVQHREDVHTALGKISDEIGDVLWYCSQLAAELDLGLDQIARANLLKLQIRKKKRNLKEHSEEDLKLSTRQVTDWCEICNKPIYEYHTVIRVEKNGFTERQFHVDCWVKNNKPQV